MTKTYEYPIKQLGGNQVFVFGSNPVGINGNPIKGTGGAALLALTSRWVNQGEKMNNCLSSSGKAWGLTTVAYPGKKLSKSPQEIQAGVSMLFAHAAEHPEQEFLVAYSGQGRNLNGYTNQQMADMFSIAAIPTNLVFEKSFAALLDVSEKKQPYDATTKNEPSHPITSSIVRRGFFRPARP